MNYRQDRKIRKKHTKKVIAALALIFVMIYFHAHIFRGFSVAAHVVFKPIISFGNNIGNGLGSTLSYFKSKKALNFENQELKAKIREQEAELSNHGTLVSENLSLKSTLERNKEGEFILAGILSKPHKSPYDTLVIDIGEDHLILPGDEVFAYGDVPIGRIDQVFENSSKVVLYSSAGEKKEVIVAGKDIYLETVGRGGGNFEMNIPRDMELAPGTEVTIPGIFPYTLAKVETIISDPRDSFVKALLVSPVNIFELKFVEVKK